MIATLLLALSPALPQTDDAPEAEPEKRRLEHEDADAWRSVSGAALSRDGGWLLYRIVDRKGKGDLFVATSDGETTSRHRVQRATMARFDADGAYVVALVPPDEDEVEAAKEREEDPPVQQLAVLSLPDGPTETIAAARGFQVPAERGGWIAWQGHEASQEPEGVEELKKGKPSGHDLVVREMATGRDRTFAHVVSYRFSEDGERLAFVTSSRDGAADGVHVWTVGGGAPLQVLSGPCDVRSLVFDDDGGQIAFLTNVEEYGDDDAGWALYHWSDGRRAHHVAAAGDAGIPEGWEVSANSAPSFSDSGGRLFFRTAPSPEPEPEIPAEDKVVLDVWSWTDDRLQPQQLVQLSRDRRRTFPAVAHVHAGAPRLVQLATAEQPDVSFADGRDGELALASTDLPYRKMSSWDTQTFRDVWLVDVLTGERRQVIERRRGRFSLSPAGRYITWWDGEALAYLAYEVATGESRDITSSIPHPLEDELNDRPMLPGSYGVGGWLPDDEGLLVYDRFDVWLCDPAGGFAPRCVTEGAGREAQTRLRIVRLDREEPWLDPQAELLLSAFDQRTKAGGFWRDRVAGAERPAEVLMGPYRYSTPTKADDADVVRFTRQSFEEYGDVWVSGTDFTDARKLTDANPQQAEFLWGRAGLHSWVSSDGQELDGILVKPEGFDPSAPYPLLVYFYERSSDRLHSYSTPVPGSSSVKYPFYTSRGYVVFVPDIPYEVGYPGKSAERAVLSGVQSLVDAGIADPKRVGVQGHSWGGYQIAHLVTRSDAFACAIAGAPVSNMTSAYGGIRWSSGMSRMFQYEHTQSRIGGTLWDELELYLENSPLFHAEHVDTPLLMLHNDEDGAVPWYQGIEYFVALRRLGKPAWLLNYNGEGHGLGKTQNRRDYAIRMQQFLDHYCLGEPAPRWMVEGVPAILKGRDLGLEPVGEAGAGMDDRSPAGAR